jgi:DNA-directed RNA polymerase specialized sigma24 family protein
MFQCAQEQDEYLQAHVQRFLRLRAHAPSVQDDIVTEAMIKGLRLGLATQYLQGSFLIPWRSYCKKNG